MVWRFNRVEEFSSIVKNKKRLIIACAVGGLGLISASAGLFFCRQPIEVESVPVSVATSYYGPENKPQQLRSSHGALTSWKFDCVTSLKYSFEEKVQMSPKKWQVRIKITGAKLKLSLPINTYLPKDPTPHIVRHEEGHVTICRRIYADSAMYAKKAAEATFKRTYTGEGSTFEQACQHAAGIAANEIREEYKVNTSEKVSSISEIYDFLQSDKKVDPGKSVDEAFSLVAKGKSRRLS